MAVEILAKYTRQLIMAFSAYGVQAISDQCLAEGLVAEDTYKRILDSSPTESSDKMSRTLLCALQACVNSDASCFESVLKVLKVLGSQTKLVLEIESEYFKLTMPPSERPTMEAEQLESFAEAQVPEIKVIHKFTPQLVPTDRIGSSNVLEVSDQFLAKELITDGVYKRSLVLEIEGEYFKLSMPPSKRCESPTDCAVETEQDEIFAEAQVPEINVIQKFTPQLVRAVGSCSVLEVSDQFLAKELITDGVYKRILESSRSSDDKVRILLIAVKDAIRTDSSCFEMAMDILKAFPLCSEVILGIESEYKKFTSQGSPNGKCTTSDDQARPRARHLAVHVSPEIRAIQKYTPELISAISTCLQEVSDQCSAKGLISESKQKRLHEATNMCSEDKVRMLLQSIKDNTAIDERCFEIFLATLSNEMPHAISRSLISSIKEEYQQLVLTTSAAPGLQEFEADKLFSILEQNVLDKLDEAIEKRVLADIEKKRLENELDMKIKENDELKEKLEAALKNAKGHNHEKDEDIRRLRRRITECEAEIDGLNDKISKQQETIEKYQMQVKREQAVAQEGHRKVVDALKVATEAEKEVNEKVQLQSDELSDLKLKVDILQQERLFMNEMNETQERKILELQASIERLEQMHADPPNATVR